MEAMLSREWYRELSQRSVQILEIFHSTKGRRGKLEKFPNSLHIVSFRMRIVASDYFYLLNDRWKYNELTENLDKIQSV